MVMATPAPTISSNSDVAPALSTLRALYQNATRAFVRRDTALTQSLIDSAFVLLPPPDSASIQDPLSSYRRKWDILRITFETTLYSTPGAPASNAVPPSPSLRSNLILSPQSLLATLHTRSLRLFTPPIYKPSSVFLPPQIVVALALASLKLNCPDVGRGFIEEWLKRRGGNTGSDLEGYLKVVDVYCLNVLPCLGEWDAALECLEALNDIPAEKQKRFLKKLHTLQTQAFTAASATRRPPSPDGTATPLIPSRSSSPASSVSSTSTRTAVPTAPRLPKQPNGTAATGNGNAKVPSSPATPTPSTIFRNKIASLPNGHANGNANGSASDDTKPTNGNSNGSAAPFSYPLPTAPPLNLDPTRPSSSNSMSSHTSSSNNPPIPTTLPELYTTLQTVLTPYLRLLYSKLPHILLFLLPLVALLFRVRGRRRKGVGVQKNPETEAARAAVNQARQTLRAGASRAGAQGPVRWLLQAVRDTIVMAGKGIV